MPYCLHIWKKIGSEFEMPPSILVGFKDMSPEEFNLKVSLYIQNLSKEGMNSALNNQGIKLNRKMRRK